MTQCGTCGKVYDESDYAKCPYCGDRKWFGFRKQTLSPPKRVDLKNVSIKQIK